MTSWHLDQKAKAGGTHLCSNWLSPKASPRGHGIRREPPCPEVNPQKHSRHLRNPWPAAQEAHRPPPSPSENSVRVPKCAPRWKSSWKGKSRGASGRALHRPCFKCQGDPPRKELFSLQQQRTLIGHSGQNEGPEKQARGRWGVHPLPSGIHPTEMGSLRGSCKGCHPGSPLLRDQLKAP